MAIKRASPSKRDIGTSLAGLVGPAIKPQTLFTFQSGGRGGIRTHGCFHIGGFHRRNRPLCHPSRSITSSSHQSHGPLSSFPSGLLLRPPYRYGLHAAQTGFLRPGLVATFRLVCRACSPSPFVVRTVCDTSNSMSRKSFYTSNDKIKKNPYSVE